VDYRGYGKSGGWPTEKGLYQDAETAFIHLLGMGYRAQQIVLHGESLGSAVAIDLAYRRPCAALILEAPFTSASDVAWHCASCRRTDTGAELQFCVEDPLECPAQTLYPRRPG